MAVLESRDYRAARERLKGNPVIAMMAAVWTTAQGTGCHPVKAQTPRSTSSRPIVFVAQPAFAAPRIFPTIIRCRGIPLRILL